MDFGTKGHEVEEKEYTSPYIKGGICVARITKIEYHTSQSGKEAVAIFHETKPVDGLVDETGKTMGLKAETRWWMSANAWPYTKDRLVIMADKLGVRDALDAITVESAQDYAMALNSVFAGKVARWKFSEEEIQGGLDDTGKQKNNWWKAQLSAFGFCEDHTIPEAESKLKWVETNKYDKKYLPESDAPTASASANDGGSSDSDEDEPWA